MISLREEIMVVLVKDITSGGTSHDESEHAKFQLYEFKNLKRPLR
jgi:hypothetical protein